VAAWLLAHKLRRTLHSLEYSWGLSSLPLEQD